MDSLVERKQFGERVRALREKRGWPLDELAIRLGKSRASISRMETGKQNLTFDDIAAIARALEVDTRVLFGDEGHMEPFTVTTDVKTMVHQCAQKIHEAQEALSAATDMADTLERLATV